MGSPTYSLAALAAWCRALRHGHGAGLTLVQVFRSQARNGPAELRPSAERIAQRLQLGESLEDALAVEKDRFPSMFIDLVGIGEQTGHLPEIFGELERYFQLQLSLRRQLRQQLTWPIFQFVAAVGIIALVILIFGYLGTGPNTKPIDPMGLGLVGVSGALTFLGGVGAILAGIYLLWKLVTRSIRGAAQAEAMLLKLPGVGAYLQALALQQFCRALRLTMETGMPTDQAVRRALRASGNAAFLAQEESATAQLQSGEAVTATLQRFGSLFPEEFLHIVEVAEASGRLPEVMEQQADFYREEAERRLRGLTQAVSIGVYVLVGLFIIWAIFRLASIYLNALQGQGV